MQPKLLKFILDIESVIDELEQVKVKAMNDFTLFKADILLQREVWKLLGKQFVK